jgi:hypothetical protein
MSCMPGNAGGVCAGEDQGVYILRLCMCICVCVCLGLQDVEVR